MLDVSVVVEGWLSYGWVGGCWRWNFIGSWPNANAAEYEGEEETFSSMSAT